MIGDVADFVRRMRQVLPVRWFADVAPFANAVLCGLAAAWEAIYLLIITVRAQARIATATGSFLDLISTDFFGFALPRWTHESDHSFEQRMHAELLRPRGTRAALAHALLGLTGRHAQIFAPVRPKDTGGYSAGGVGYGAAGGWGNLALRHASFVTAFRPVGAGIAYLAGYDTGGVLAYGNLSMVATQVSDAQIAASVAAVLPVGHTAWLRIES